jgi:hypothetical protein
MADEGDPVAPIRVAVEIRVKEGLERLRVHRLVGVQTVPAIDERQLERAVRRGDRLDMVVLAVVERQTPVGDLRRKIDGPHDVVAHGIIGHCIADLQRHCSLLGPKPIATQNRANSEGCPIAEHRLQVRPHLTSTFMRLRPESLSHRACHRG